ncbi:DUF2577 domain-containing protein [Paenibacillus sp. GCM10027626]|uniref:DUF2577 domain-containing protein n=1 Tax=Paenibacillus sp. GCM10027626 TaxID=3273411 RepID=UPI00362EA0B2
MSLVDVMKKISVGAVEASSPAAIYYGTIISTDPLKVNVDQRFNLPKDFLVVPETLMEYKAVIGGQEVVIRRGLETGDHVVMLRAPGGQQYILLDRVVE